MRNRSIIGLVLPGLLALGVMRAGAQSGEWRQLYNGKDLTNWEHVGPGGFTILAYFLPVKLSGGGPTISTAIDVERGLLEPHGGMGLLWYTSEKLGNEQIRIVFKPVENSSNSGVFIRIPEKPTEPWMPVNRGYEVQIDNADDDYHCTGVLYSLTKALARPQKAGEWNTMEITLDGPHTIVTVNGVKVTDYTEGQPVPPKNKKYEPDRGRRRDEGYIGLQNHSDKDVVYFKEVAVKPLGR